LLAEQAPGARMRRSPARPSSGLAGKQRHSINSSARTGTPGTNIKMSTIACWAAPTPAENFVRLGFARRRRTRQSAADAFARRTLYGYRPGGRDLSHDLNCTFLAVKSLSVWRSRGEWMAIDVRRRKFIAVLSGALVGRAIPAYAQQAARTYTVGVLMGFTNDAEAKARVQAFEQGLEREGWSVGQNLRIEYRYAEGDSVRMQALAKELVEVKPDCILGHSTPVVTALMQATRTIPIVFVSVSDPIGSGFVASIARPGGNMTGFTIFPATITGKY